MNWCEVEYILLKTLRLQPSELDRMAFWRAELLIEIHKEKIEEENKQRKKQEQSQGGEVGGMNSLLSQQKSMMSSFATGGGFKMPKM
jgi:hypothetical protein